jgi:hypothetical protein
VSIQVLDPPLGSFESLHLRSWPRVSIYLGFFSLFILFYALKKKRIFYFYFFFFKHFKKIKKIFFI